MSVLGRIISYFVYRDNVDMSCLKTKSGSAHAYNQQVNI